MSRDVIIEEPTQLVVPRGTSRHGLVIGIDQYADARLNLRCAVADARAVHALMVDPRCGCFPAHNVQLLVNEQATTRDVFRALSRLSKDAGENDTVWIYYAGHGAVHEDAAYWVTHDTEMDDLFGTALGSDRITRALARLRSKRLLLILDCCHAAATADMKNLIRQAAKPEELFDPFQGDGRIMLAASDGTQRSIELSEHGHGAFTYYLAEGLRGAADVDGQGVVTVDKLWPYVAAKVGDAAGRAGNKQTPVLKGEMTLGVALTLNSAVLDSRQRLERAIRLLVRLDAPRLTTDEGMLCLNILRRGPRGDAERQLLERMQEFEAGQLSPKVFCHVVNLHVKQTSAAPETLKQLPAPQPGLPPSPPQTRQQRPSVAWKPVDAAEFASPVPWAVESGQDRYGRWAAFEVRGVRQQLRWIPSGSFLMGSPPTEVGRWDNEGPQHWVTLTSGYWLGQTAVTQALWRAVMTFNPSRFVSDDRPVEQVNWDDCVAFIERLNGLLDGFVARLPTEAEWERACRAETTAATWVGDLTLRGDNDAPELDTIAWYGGNSGVDFDLNSWYDSSGWADKQHPHTRAGTRLVGRLQANPYGLHDMLGNVYEWCHDPADNVQPRPYTSTPISDPLPPDRGSYRVARGGSWDSFARYVRAAYRRVNPRSFRDVYLGFRLAG